MTKCTMKSLSEFHKKVLLTATVSAVEEMIAETKSTLGVCRGCTAAAIVDACEIALRAHEVPPERLIAEYQRRIQRLSREVTRPDQTKEKPPHGYH